MELKMITFLCTILVLLYHPTVSSPVDDNAIADLVLMNYFNIMNATGTTVGCCPAIVVGPQGSLIQPISGRRAGVALIVDYGSCSVHDQGFMCGVDWGDGTKQDTKKLDKIGPCNMIHQYPQVDAQYTVTAYYCGPSDGQGGTSCCKSYVRTIDTSKNIGGIGELNL